MNTLPPSPFPPMPTIIPVGKALLDTSVKVANSSDIVTSEEPIPIDIVSQLLFEQVGGIEIINIARNDIINGQRVSYNLVGNLNSIQQIYNPRNIFKISGTSQEFFENFGIRFSIHVPENGTADPNFYRGLSTLGIPTTYPVFNRYTNQSISFSSPALADEYVNEKAAIRDTVYIDRTTGNLVIDVTSMEINERVDVEVLTAGAIEDDTVY
jgi:hypothetical protein